MVKLSYYSKRYASYDLKRSINFQLTAMFIGNFRVPRKGISQAFDLCRCLAGGPWIPGKWNQQCSCTFSRTLSLTNESRFIAFHCATRFYINTDHLIGFIYSDTTQVKVPGSPWEKLYYSILIWFLSSLL